MADAERFLSQRGKAAARLGWTADDLFGLHQAVPLHRIDCRGLIWLIEGERVILLIEGIAGLSEG